MRAADLAFVVSLLFATNGVCDERVVGGERYLLRDNGRWFLIDNYSEEWEIAPGLVFVKFAQALAPEVVQTSFVSASLVLDRARPGITGFYRFRYSAERNPVDVVAEVLSFPLVQAAFLDTYVRFLGEPNDSYYSELWHLSEIRAERGWDVTTGSSNVTIAIIDDGFETDHEDLADVMWSNPNEIPGDGMDNDADSLWYGTPLPDDTLGWDFIDDEGVPPV